MKKIYLLLTLLGSMNLAISQTLYGPNFTSTGIANNTSNGNVGIGTPNPNSNLHLRSQLGNATLIIQGKQDNNVGNNAELILSTEYSTGNMISGTQTGRKSLIRATAGSAWGTNVRLGFFTSSSDSSYPKERMVVSPNGYIGIGTTNPDQQLTISNNDNPVLRFERSGTNKHDWEIYSQSGGSLLFRGGANAVGASLNDYLTIQSDGNIGIGTNGPDSKLTVKGDIHTQEVKVDLLGSVMPDFVFEEEYKLRTLEETERFIKSNKHLPEIPSAAEVAIDGILLKEMNLKLLQKVEELTLYLIEQNKKIERLHYKVEQLENK